VHSTQKSFSELTTDRTFGPGQTSGVPRCLDQNILVFSPAAAHKNFSIVACVWGTNVLDKLQHYPHLHNVGLLLFIEVVLSQVAYHLGPAFF
jgi:hypothetical protein